jgi:hypothetical protein
MKINWGTGIVMVFVLFVFGMSLLVYISLKNRINLVHKDYYPREIAHQTMIDKVNNAASLPEIIKITNKGDSLEVAFPANFDFDKVTGEILVYRPSDDRKDVHLPINLSSNGLQTIPTDNLYIGKYIVKVDWMYEEVAFYHEQDIHIK